MINDEAWHFARMGRLLERSDKTSRILDVNCHRMLPEEGDQSLVFESIHWSALLRATSALNAFRRCRGRISPAKVVEFLMLDQEFPRSVLHGLIQTQASLYTITGTPMGHFASESERLLGHLRADLSYVTIEDVFDQALHRFCSLPGNTRPSGTSRGRCFWSHIWCAFSPGRTEASDWSRSPCGFSRNRQVPRKSKTPRGIRPAPRSTCRGLAGAGTIPRWGWRSQTRIWLWAQVRSPYSPRLSRGLSVAAEYPAGSRTASN